MNLARMAGVSLLVASGAFFAGCGEDRADRDAGAESPPQVAKSYLRALAAGDCASVKKRVVAPDNVDCGWVAESSSSAGMSAGDVDGASYTVIDEGDGAATVEVSMAGEEPAHTDLVQQDDRWLVVLEAAE